MRRRDATDHRLHLDTSAGRPALASLLVSCVLHAALLGLAGRWLLMRAAPPPLIPVSLLLAAGGQAAAGGEAKAAAASAQPVPKSAVTKVAARPRRRQSRSARPRILSAPRGSSPALSAEGAPRKQFTDVSAAEMTGDPAASGSSTRIGGADANGHGGHGGDGAGAGGAGPGVGLGNGNAADQRGYCLYCPEPRYPLIARARGWQGTVHVALSVSADGSVAEANLRESSGYGVLDRAAIDVARHSRFEPPATRGLTTPLHGRIEYRFQLSNAMSGGMR